MITVRTDYSNSLFFSVGDWSGFQLAAFFWSTSN